MDCYIGGKQCDDHHVVHLCALSPIPGLLNRKVEISAGYVGVSQICQDASSTFGCRYVSLQRVKHGCVTQVKQLVIHNVNPCDLVYTN